MDGGDGCAKAGDLCCGFAAYAVGVGEYLLPLFESPAYGVLVWPRCGSGMSEGMEVWLAMSPIFLLIGVHITDRLINVN